MIGWRGASRYYDNNFQEAFGLHEVIFIPAALPPHKATEKIIEPLHRLEMVKRAIQRNPYFSASDVELRRSGKSYSIDTIRYFRERHQSLLFFFILGRDAFASAFGIEPLGRGRFDTDASHVDFQERRYIAAHLTHVRRQSWPLSQQGGINIFYLPTRLIKHRSDF
jgi:hypothetical protein